MSETPKKTVAVWLQLEPDQPLRGEGIGEHLMRLLNGVRELGDHEVIVCAPRWAGRVVHDMLSEHGLHTASIRVRLFGFGLSLPRISLFGRKQKPPPGDPLPMWYARRLVDIPAWGFLILLGLLLSPLLLPLWLGLKLAKRVSKPLSIRIAERIHGVRRALVYAGMARFIDSNRAITGCIVPIGNWSFCRYIERKPIVVQIPDIVFMEFPDLWKGDATALSLMEDIRYVARHAGAVVCPSEHVKATHLVRGLGVPPDKVYVVEHAPIRADEAFNAYCVRQGLPPTTDTALAICRDFQLKSMIGASYHGRVDNSAYWLSRARDPGVWDRPVLYFPTQYRPYKNIEQVLRAIARLRDQHGLEVSLMVTGDLSASPAACELVDFLKLHDQVIPLPRAPHHIHAALYVAADLVIAASSFEGGFPFLFAEAVSVGTPVVMARIPVTLEQIRGPMLQRMTFDPADVADMTDRIRHALDDPRLVERQKALFEQIFAGRTWKDVAKGYLDALYHAGSPTSREPAPDLSLPMTAKRPEPRSG